MPDLTEEAGPSEARTQNAQPTQVKKPRGARPRPPAHKAGLKKKRRPSLAPVSPVTPESATVDVECAKAEELGPEDGAEPGRTSKLPDAPDGSQPAKERVKKAQELLDRVFHKTNTIAAPLADIGSSWMRVAWLGLVAMSCIVPGASIFVIPFMFVYCCLWKRHLLGVGPRSLKFLPMFQEFGMWTILFLNVYGDILFVFRSWELLDVQPGARVTQNELPNQGLEAFTFRRKTLVAGLEGPLVQDDPQVRRIMEVDTEGRLLWSGFLLVDATTPPPLLLSELAALELNRSGGPRYLALERRWSRQMGNDIRLYLLDVAGADDVSNCSAICDGACAFQGHWWKGAMAVVPPEAFGHQSYEELGGVAVLLVNDNNDNPRQLGTQFVLFRLAFDTPTTPVTPGHPRSTTSGAALVAVASVLGLVLLSLACCCYLRSRRCRSRRHQALQEEMDERGGARQIGRAQLGAAEPRSVV
eukprot:g25867.t1